MKTFKQFQHEEYYGLVQNAFDDDSEAVYKNPSRSELSQILKDHKRELQQFRFLVDLDKNDVYVFFFTLLHTPVFKKVKAMNTIRGVGEFKNGKILVTSALVYNWGKVSSLDKTNYEKLLKMKTFFDMDHYLGLFEDDD